MTHAFSTPLSFTTKPSIHSSSVVLFCNHWLGKQGGAERYLFALANHLRDRGFSCALFYAEEGHEASSCAEIFDHCIRIQDKRITEDHFKTFSPKWIIFYQWPYEDLLCPFLQHIPRWVQIHDSAVFCPREHKYFLWDSQTCHHPMGWNCALRCGQLDGLPGLSSLLEGKIKKNLSKLQQLRYADKILCGSAYLAHMLGLHDIEPERITTLPLALPFAPLSSPLPSRKDASPIPSPPLQTSEPTTRILFVGSLLRSKGIDLLLHALWKLQQPFHCEIIGQGAQEHSFRLWADALGFGKGSRSHQCVQFVGWRSPEALHDHYQRADILVLPSRSPETFGLVGLEAMHHGLPVIAFDVGGVSEWLQHGHTGYLVPPGDLSALADRLSQLIEDPKKRAAFSEHAQQRAASCFSFEKHLDAFVRML